MPLSDRTSFLTSPAEVDAFLKENPTAVILKAGLCHKTPETFVHVKGLLDPPEDLKLRIIKVGRRRGQPVANRCFHLGARDPRR